MPVRLRGGGSLDPASPTKRIAPAEPGRALPAAPGRASTASSTIVFHSPHVSHLPAQRGVTAPQAWQT